MSGKTYLSPRILDSNTRPALSIIRNRAGVVIRRLHAAIELLDSIEDTLCAGAGALRLRNSPLRGVLRIVAIGHRTRIRLVQVQVVGVHLPVSVTGLLGDKVKEVGSAVPATQRGKVPVRRQRSNNGVKRIEGVVLSPAEVVRNRAAKKEAEDLVSNLIRIGLVEREQNQSILREVLVLQQVMQKAVGPATGKGDVCVVSVVGHVRRDEHVLGQFLVLQIIVKGREVLDLSQARVILRNGVEKD